MSIRSRLKNGVCSLVLAGSLALGAAGCVSKNTCRIQPQFYTPKKADVMYKMEYDLATLPLMIKLYKQDNKGKMPSSFLDVMPYRRISRDLNHNGILDYVSTIEIYKKEGKPYLMRERVVLKAKANTTGRPIERNIWYLVNKDRSVTRAVDTRATFPGAVDKFYSLVKGKHKSVKASKDRLDKATKSYDKLKVKKTKKVKASP